MSQSAFVSFGFLGSQKALAESVGLSNKLKNMSFVRETVEQSRSHAFILECVIMPFSLIALLVEAILEAE